MYLNAEMSASACAGSVIFSQSLLAYRGGVRSRLQGATIASLELATFLIPVSLVHFLPNWYYGGCGCSARSAHSALLVQLQWS
jgi:MFS superfamily sulfate permease-like transporter